MTSPDATPDSAIAVTDAEVIAQAVAELEPITLETEVPNDEAEQEISAAVSARHSVARKWVIWVRRRRPDASPAEVIQLLERHYGTTITTTGVLISLGAIAADVGISLIPVVGQTAAGAKSASKQVAKHAGKEVSKAAAKAAVKQAAKGAALGVAKSGAERVAAMLPAGDQQLQFEITAIFALAIADIHSMNLDKDQAHALVYGLTNDRVGPTVIATMASDVATMSSGGVIDVSQKIASGRGDWSHWANTLAGALPAGGAREFVRTIQTGQLDTVRENLTGKQAATIEYGVGALTGGVTRFVFGVDVIRATREAFDDAPEEFPSHLAVVAMASSGAEDKEADENFALAALQEGAKVTGNWIVGTASTVGQGVATAADVASRPFRSVDIDGDGIPDEPRALTAVKSIGGAVAGAAGAVGGGVAGLFKPRKKDKKAASELLEPDAELQHGPKLDEGAEVKADDSVPADAETRTI
jgi:hypothetical protein